MRLYTRTPFPIRGRDVENGLPATLEIGATEIYSALEEQMDKLFDLITQTLAETPPELAGDVLSRGAVLCGGGALLKGLPRVSRRRSIFLSGWRLRRGRPS